MRGRTDARCPGSAFRTPWPLAARHTGQPGTGVRRAAGSPPAGTRRWGRPRVRRAAGRTLSPSRTSPMPVPAAALAEGARRLARDFRSGRPSRGAVRVRRRPRGPASPDGTTPEPTDGELPRRAAARDPPGFPSVRHRPVPHPRHARSNDLRSSKATTLTVPGPGSGWGTTLPGPSRTGTTTRSASATGFREGRDHPAIERTADRKRSRPAVHPPPLHSSGPHVWRRPRGHLEELSSPQHICPDPDP